MTSREQNLAVTYKETPQNILKVSTNKNENEDTAPSSDQSNIQVTNRLSNAERHLKQITKQMLQQLEHEDQKVQFIDRRHKQKTAEMDKAMAKL